MKVGFALRSSVFHPSLVGDLAHLLEREGVDSIWFPDVGQSFDAIDLCAVALGSTRRMRVGTGVIRVGEQEPARLASRARTLSESSGGRFVLGLGAGRVQGPAAVKAVVELAERFRAAYGAKGVPPVLFAALRGGMLRAALSRADGAILNFCPPSHVERILPERRPRGFTVACYVKLFVAQRGDAYARRMLVEEMATYDRFPGYHKMFEAAGVADLIAGLRPGTRQLPEPLLEIALANPSVRETEDLLGRFARAGVDLPVVYPYVSGDSEYQKSAVRRLATVASSQGG
jgi:Luciferase-like monooxygenase